MFAFVGDQEKIFEGHKGSEEILCVYIEREISLTIPDG